MLPFCLSAWFACDIWCYRMCFDWEELLIAVGECVVWLGSVDSQEQQDSADERQPRGDRWRHQRDRRRLSEVRCTEAWVRRLNDIHVDHPSTGTHWRRHLHLSDHCQGCVWTPVQRRHPRRTQSVILIDWLIDHWAVKLYWWHFPNVVLRSRAEMSLKMRCKRSLP